MVTKPWFFCSLTESQQRPNPRVQQNLDYPPCDSCWDPLVLLQRSALGIGWEVLCSKGSGICLQSPHAAPGTHHHHKEKEKRAKPGNCPLQTWPAGTPCWIPDKGPAAQATAPCPFPEPEFPCAAHPAPWWALGAKGESWTQPLGAGRSGGRAAEAAALWAGGGERGIIGLSTNCLPS